MTNKIIFNEYKLSELVDIKGGKRLPKGSNLTSVKTNHPYVRVRDLNNKRLIEINDDIQYIDNQTFELVRNYKTFAKDILISIVGTVGLIGIVGNSLDGANLTENCVKLTNLRNIDHRYLYYFLISDFGKNEIMKGTVGAVQPKLPIKNISNIIIKLPSVNNQFKIANILSCFDDKIELNNKIIKNLEKLVQILYKRWFVDFEFPNEEGKPYKSSGGEMVESELGLIPEGWEVLSLGEVLKENIRGFSPKYTQDKKNGIPVINQRCLRNHTITEEAVQYHDNKLKLANLKFYHKEWDVLINSMGVGTLGRVSISSISSNRLVHSCISILRNNEKVKKGFFSFLILSLENKFVAMGEGTTGQTSLNNKEIAKIKVIIPGLKVQEKNDDIFINLVAKIDSNNSQNKKLSELRDLLLPKLMSGEIEVQDKE